MSLYRRAVRNGVLIREKRKLFRFWMWAFNRSEEDHIVRMKNRLIALRQEQANLMKMIPEHEKRIMDEKQRLMNHADGTGPPYRDAWTPRREPARLNLDVKTGGNKRPKAPAKPKPLLEIRAPD